MKPLLLRIEEACTYSDGRIRLLDYDEIKELYLKGFIAEYNELPDTYAHDYCTHIVWLTDSGYIEAYRLRKCIAEKRYKLYIDNIQEVNRIVKSVNK